MQKFILSSSSSRLWTKKYCASPETQTQQYDTQVIFVTSSFMHFQSLETSTYEKGGHFGRKESLLCGLQSHATSISYSSSPAPPWHGDELCPLCQEHSQLGTTVTAMPWHQCPSTRCHDTYAPSTTFQVDLIGFAQD